MSSSEDLPRYPQERPVEPSGQWQPSSAGGAGGLSGPPAHSGTSSEERNWAVAAHIGSFLAAYIALGLLAPLAVLLFKGNTSPFIRRHAIESLNFQITVLIYAAVCFLLLLLLVGIFFFVALGIFYVVIVIVASMRASRGENFRYPLTFHFVS
jgi:uncharacterized Tic20 family protein